VLVLAGCGGDDKPPPPQPTAPPVTSDTVPLTIDEPVASQTLKATRIGGGRLGAPLDVKGQAEPGTAVRVSTGCHVSGCAATDKAEVDNQWAVHVVVKAPESHPSALVKVADAADQSDVVFVEVRLHAKPRKLPKSPPQAAPEPDAPPNTPSTPAAPPPSAPAPSGTPPKTFTMIGDSLAVGTQPYLPSLLPGFKVTTNAQTGRPLATGMQILNTTAVNGPTALAFSLFTNDDPSHVAQLESAVRTSVSRAGASGCAIWATIVRPPVNGVSYAAANRKLVQLAAQLPRLRIVPWAATVNSHPSWVGADGVHATATGYKARAQMYADAARSC
jgi:hypothetical protein